MADESVTNYSFSEEFFNKYMDKDNITKDWILTGSPYPVLTYLAAYLLFVLKIGPYLMVKKDPYKLKQLMRLYNVIQVIYNIFILNKGVRYDILEGITNNSCKISTNVTDHMKHDFLIYSWHFLVLKMLDLLDTVFLVLRKKNSHVTFLHVFHHVSMVLGVWFVLSYVKSVQGVLPGLINVFVHVVMYTYYFLATFSSCKKYLWWKKHLTQLQLGQFVVILLYISLLYYKGCQISRVFVYLTLGVVSVILILFVNFYSKTYRSSVTDSREKSS